MEMVTMMAVELGMRNQGPKWRGGGESKRVKGHHHFIRTIFFLSFFVWLLWVLLIARVIFKLHFGIQDV